MIFYKDMIFLNRFCKTKKIDIDIINYMIVEKIIVELFIEVNNTTVHVYKYRKSAGI